jgi:hypothetical protein
MGSMTNDDLFNCCAGGVAPNWSAYRWLVIGGCIEDKENPGHIIGGIADDEAEFWTVYGMLKGGGTEAITDCPTRADVDCVAERLSQLSGLQVI